MSITPTLLVVAFSFALLPAPARADEPTGRSALAGRCAGLRGQARRARDIERLLGR